MATSFLRQVFKASVGFLLIAVVGFLPAVQAVVKDYNTYCITSGDCALYDPNACSVEGTVAPGGNIISGDLKSLAQQILDNPNISFDYGKTGPTGTQFTRLSQGQKAQTDDGREVDVEPIILVTILHMAQGHKVNVSALTDGSSHTAPTNPHGSGKAADINIFDGSHTNGSDDVANKIINSAAEVLPAGARFGMGDNPFGTKQIAGKTFSSFADHPTHVHIDVMGVAQADDDKAVQAAGGTGTSGGASNSVYILGDSIAVRSQGAYEQAFRDKHYSAVVDGSSSRSISAKGTDGNKLSGMEAIAQDKSEIQSASAVVVALGTNGDNTPANIDSVISAIGPGKTIYWVDTIAVGRSDDSIMAKGNQAIYGQETTSGKQNYTVISWFSTVDPKGNPQHPATHEQDPNNYIDNSDGLGVHPTPAGSKALASLVADAVTSDTTSASTSNTCCGSGGSSVLSGDNNGLRAINYFVGRGLSKEVASGIIGNLAAESVGVEPQRKQGDFTGYHTSQSLTPAELTDSNLGWGVAQFTPPEKIVTVSRDKNVPYSKIDTLSYQLDFLWNSFQSNEKAAFDAFKGASTPEDAATLFEAKYERPQTTADSGTRGSYARAYYNLATKNTPLPPNVPVSKTDVSGYGSAGSSALSTPAGASADSGNAGDNSCAGASTSTTDTSSISAYKNPFRDIPNLAGNRIDEGVDYGGSGPVHAIGSGHIVNINSGDWLTGVFIVYQLDDGPAKDKYVYVAENCTPKVSSTDKWTGSDKIICDMVDASPHIETGWAQSPSNGTIAMAYSVYKEGYVTAFGVNFSELMKCLGDTTSHSRDTTTVYGTLPSDWPKWTCN